MEFFTGDLHIGDKDVIVYEHRPFNSVEHMNRTLIANWNNRVTPKDDGFILGDIGDPRVILELHGKLTIVVGNHDDYDALIKVASARSEYTYISKYPIIVNSRILSHEPLGYLPPESVYLNIHAHLHKFNYGLLDRRWSAGNRYFCVSVEQTNFAPITIAEMSKVLDNYKI